MAQLTLLEAVNRVLRANGEQPVSSLSTDGTNDTSIAQQMITEAITQFQIRYNEPVKWDGVMTTDGKIPLPADILQVDGRDTDESRKLIRKGAYLFDVGNNTDVFTKNVTLYVKYEYAFEDLDPAYQYMIIDQVSVDYQGDIKGDPQVDARLRERARMSKAVAMSKLTKTRSSSWLNTTDLIANTYRAR